MSWTVIVLRFRPQCPIGMAAGGVKFSNQNNQRIFTSLIFNVIFFLLNRSTLSVIAAYLDAFQKIADSATNAKGKQKTFHR